MPDNLSKVELALRDVRGKVIKDSVSVTLTNLKLRSLDRRLTCNFEGQPQTLPDIAGFPNGTYQVFISPTKYRAKAVFANVPAGSPAVIDEILFVDPEAVKIVAPPFTTLRSEPAWSRLFSVLEESEIDAAKYNALTSEQKAGLFNLQAKMTDQKVASGRDVFDFVEGIVELKPARIFAIVSEALLAEARNSPQQFRVEDGSLHEFPRDFKRIDTQGSFKTRERCGNLQLTFARNAGGELMVDADLDDHSGIRHAFDVIKHAFTGKDTHPYNIHQLLVCFQNISPGYDFA